MSGQPGTAFRALCLALWLLAVPVQGADAPPVAQHLGVASCAGSTCHGAIRPIGTHPIRQDEYLIWQRKEAHAGAYNLLLEPRSNDISRRLGWGEAAQAKGCLSCHVDNAAESARGAKWLLTDGVGCEVCHGGAGGWIDTHVHGYESLDQARAAGLYPTWEPAARAQLCLSCHQGSRERPMTHAVMAAGHPPLLFELDTFSTLQPLHHDIDADYVKRKGEQDPARNWLVGQVVAAEQFLGDIESGRHHKGLMPELAFFDCDACHHPMKAGRASAARSGGAEPGLVPLADASLVLLGAWAKAVDPALADRWQKGWSALYVKGYASDAALRSEAAKMRALLRAELRPRMGMTLNAAQLRRVLDAVLATASTHHAGDYRFAEQTAMASLLLAAALPERGAGAFSDEQKAAVDALYEAVKDRDRFNSATWRKTLAQLQARLAG